MTRAARPLPAEDDRAPRTRALAAALTLAVASTLLPAPVAAEGTGREGTAALSTAARARIEQRLRKAQLDPTRFALEPLAGWPQDRLRLIAANPLKDKLAVASVFAVLPDDTVVMAGDPGGFRRLVGEAFPAPRPGDAAAIAELAVLFGAYGRPVGILVSRLPATRAGAKVPRADARPVMTRRDGTVRLDHYSYDFDRQRLFDCHLELGPGDAAEGSCTQVE